MHDDDTPTPAEPSFWPPDPSDDAPSPFAASLLDQRDRLLNGETALDPNSHRGQQMLAELDARIEFYRRLGELPPERPVTADTVAEDMLAAEYPFGPPSLSVPPGQLAWLRDKLDTLAKLPEPLLRERIADTSADFAYDAGRAGVPHLLANRKDPAKARPIVDALVDDATPVVQAMAATPDQAARWLEVIRADRGLLEYFSAKGQQVGAYLAKRAAYGLSGSTTIPATTNQPRTSAGRFYNRKAS